MESGSGKPNSQELGGVDRPPPLRLALEETAADLAHRIEREQRAEQLQRESDLEQKLAPFRVGSVPYLNAVPLTRGLEDQIVFQVPSRLAELLRRDELDAALVSVAEVLLTDRYDILDGIAVASLGEVQSAFLAHRGPLDQATQVYCDTASISTFNLLRVLLAERGLRPVYQPFPPGAREPLPDYLMLIGDPALRFRQGPCEHEIWDLGAAWQELTQLPFVYAVWALRRGVENRRLRRLLREARDFGLDTLDSIVAGRTDFERDFLKDYLGWHVHFHLGADEKRGLSRFSELLERHGFGPVYAPRFVW